MATQRWVCAVPHKAALVRKSVGPGEGYRLCLQQATIHVLGFIHFYKTWANGI